MARSISIASRHFFVETSLQWRLSLQWHLLRCLATGETPRSDISTVDMKEGWLIIAPFRGLGVSHLKNLSLNSRQPMLMPKFHWLAPAE